jgi:hypothetical protein
MDSYYEKRYRHVINLVNDIFNFNISGLGKQTDMFTDMEFFFELGYYISEDDRITQLYHAHENRYEQYRGIATYENFLFKVAMPFLYMYCDDVKYIKYYMKNIGRMRTNL